MNAAAAFYLADELMLLLEQKTREPQTISSSFAPLSGGDLLDDPQAVQLCSPRPLPDDPGLLSDVVKSSVFRDHRDGQGGRAVADNDEFDSPAPVAVNVEPLSPTRRSGRTRSDRTRGARGKQCLATG